MSDLSSPSSDQPQETSDSESIAIVPATSADAAELTRLTTAAKAHWGYPAEWMAKWAGVLTISPEYIQSCIAFAAVRRSRIIGYYSLQDRNGWCWLDNLFVLPDHMGKGVGRALFEHALVQARRLGARRLEWDSDPHAAGFYIRLGARQIGANQSSFGRSLPLFTFAL